MYIEVITVRGISSWTNIIMDKELLTKKIYNVKASDNNSFHKSGLWYVNR